MFAARISHVVFLAFGLAVLLVCSRLAAAQDIVIDNLDAGFTINSGSWTTGTSASEKYGADYRYAATTTGAASAEAEWRPTILTGGDYEVSVWFADGANRAPDAAFTIEHAGGASALTFSQLVNGGAWTAIGIYAFNAGTSGRVVLRNNAGAAGDVVIADAVRFRPVAYGADEFRGIWVSRYEWPSTNPATIRANLRTVLTNAVIGGFNNVVIQFRGQADVMYPSPEEVWSTLVGGSSPGFDPLRFALDEAHARGLRLHCYFNTHVVWGSSSPPSNPSHLYYQHCNPTNPAARDWLVVNSGGLVQSSPDDGYFWLAPGHQDVQAYLRRQVMHLVNTYADLDGIHFDRIRMPGTEYSYDAASQARRLGQGNPGALGFADWTRDQFTRFLRDVYAQVRSVNATLELSSAPLGLYQQASYPGYPSGYLYGRTFCYQDAQAWMAAHAQDWIAPQIYWADGGSKPDYSDVLPDWLANAAGRHVYGGMDADASVTRTVNEVTATRNMSGPGTMYWSYGNAASNGHFTQLAGNVYANRARTPDKPWLTAPPTAIVLGTISDFATGQPILDAHITRTGDSYTTLSAADGFYCFLDVPPGGTTITVTTPTLIGTAVVSALTAGEVRRVDIALAPAGTATRLAIVNAPAQVAAGQPFTVDVQVQDAQGALVSGGTFNVLVTTVGGSGTLAGGTSGTTAAGALSTTLSYDTPETVTLQIADAAGNLTSATIAIQFTTPTTGAGGSGGCVASVDGVPGLLNPMLFIALGLLALVGVRRFRTPV